MKPKILGITEDQTFCDCCGKNNLKRTVTIDKGDEIVRYGVDCASLLLKRSAHKIRQEANAIESKRIEEESRLERELARKIQKRINMDQSLANRAYHDAWNPSPWSTVDMGIGLFNPETQTHARIPNNYETLMHGSEATFIKYLFDNGFRPITK